MSVSHITLKNTLKALLIHKLQNPDNILIVNSYYHLLPRYIAEQIPDGVVNPFYQIDRIRIDGSIFRLYINKNNYKVYYMRFWGDHPIIVSEISNLHPYYINLLVKKINMTLSLNDIKLYNEKEN